MRADYDLATDVNLRPYPQTQWPLEGAHDTRLQIVLAGADVIVNGKRLHVDARDETAARARRQNSTTHSRTTHHRKTSCAS
ncbi:MAG: hypothetical protein WDO56_30240 [Gammaproteobacteria bacterium]